MKFLKIIWMGVEGAFPPEAKSYAFLTVLPSSLKLRELAPLK